AGLNISKSGNYTNLCTGSFHWGFSDQSHFSTVFKQRFGMTPGEYRRKFR
ncbi:AraC family transcriptional regulator, partial [Escherichia coli]